MSNLSTIIKSSNDTLTRKRYTSATLVGGRSVPGIETVTPNICASVQPPRNNFKTFIAQATEGTRSRDWIVIYCAVGTFRAADDRNNTPADLVDYEGFTYEVQKLSPRKGISLRHDMVLAVGLEGG